MNFTFLWSLHNIVVLFKDENLTRLIEVGKNEAKCLDKGLDFLDALVDKQELEDLIEIGYY